MAQGLELHRLAKDSTYNFIRQIWTIFFGLIISILLARGLGKEQRGIYTLAVLLPELLVTFSNLGVAQATVFFISRKKIPPNQTISDNTTLALWIGFGSMIIGGIIILYGSSIFFPNVPVSLLILSLFIIPFSLSINYLNAIFQGLQDFKHYNLIGMASQLVMLALVIIFVWVFEFSSAGAMLAYIGSNLFGVLFLFILLLKTIGAPNRWKLLLDFHYIHQITNFSIKSHISNSLTYLNYRIDNLLLNRIAGPTPVGLYSISVGLSERLWVPSTAVGAVIFPRIASLAEGDTRREEITPLTTRFIFLLSIIIALISVPLLVWLLPILYSSDYLGSIQPLILLIPGTVAFNVGRILANDISGRGKPELNILVSFFALIINIIANLILIPIYNASGSALASTISYTSLAVITIAIYSKISSIKWHKIILLQKSDFKYIKRFFSKIPSNNKTHKA